MPKLKDVATPEQVFAQVREQLLRLSGPARARTITYDSSLVHDLGFDSLTMVEMAATIEDALELEELPLTEWREAEIEKLGPRFTVGSLLALCLEAPCRESNVLARGPWS